MNSLFPLTITDFLGRSVYLPAPPDRIISLVPSITHTLWALGLVKRVVGITHYCPLSSDQGARVTRLHGPRGVHLDEIESLNPDFIIADKEENSRPEIEAFMHKFPVYVSHVVTWNDNNRFLRDMGIIANQKPTVEFWLSVLARERKQLAAQALPRIPANYVVWENPRMVAGRNTFIQTVMHSCGMRNVWADSVMTYQQVDTASIRAKAPELVLLPSEPYPFTEADAANWHALLPQARLVLVAGEWFSWYGAFMLRALPGIRKLVCEISR